MKRVSGGAARGRARTRAPNNPFEDRRVAPAFQPGCRCSSGTCLKCNCDDSNYFCSPRCGCSPDRCRNLPKVITPVKEKQLNPLRGDRPVRLFWEVNLEEEDHVAALRAEATHAESSADSTSESEDEEVQLPGAALELEVFTIEEDEEDAFPGSFGEPEIEEEVDAVDEDNIQDQSTILSLEEDEMAELAAILRALQQQQADQQQWQQNQQAEQQRLAVEHAQAMAQMAAQLQRVGAAQPLVQPAAQPAVQQALPYVRTVMPKDVQYSGAKEECYESWLRRINQTATAEMWNDDHKRRAAIGTLRGSALKWHEAFGTAPNRTTWNDWEAGLRQNFVVPMTDSEWAIMIENRVQKPNEAASDYILDKISMFSKRAGPPLADADKVPYLIRGLSSTELRSSLLTIPPADIEDFLTAVRTREAMLRSSLGPAVVAALTPGSDTMTSPVASTSMVNNNELTNRLLENIASRLEKLERRSNPVPPPRPPFQGQYSFTTTRNTSSGSGPTAASTPVSGANAVPLGVGNTNNPGSAPTGYTPNGTQRYRFPSNQCLSCGGLGHWAKDCPNKERRSDINNQGNETAGSAGQTQTSRF